MQYIISLIMEVHCTDCKSTAEPLLRAHPCVSTIPLERPYHNIILNKNVFPKTLLLPKQFAYAL